MSTEQFKITCNCGIISQMLSKFSRSWIKFSTVAAAVRKDVTTLQHKLAWQEHSWLRFLVQTLSLISFYAAPWLWEEWGKPVFVLLCCCVSPPPTHSFFFFFFFFLEMHPGFFLSIARQQKHHFVSIFSLQAETSRQGSSGEASQRPTWLTYQWRAGEIYGSAVLHITGPDNIPPSLHHPKRKGSFLASRDVEKQQQQQQHRAPAPGLFVSPSQTSQSLSVFPMHKHTRSFP